MSEKRFELDYDDEYCACISNFLDSGEKLTDREVVDLLNEMSEENEQLKNQNIEYEEVHCRIMNYIIDKGLGSEFAKFLRENM